MVAGLTMMLILLVLLFPPIDAHHSAKDPPRTSAGREGDGAKSHEGNNSIIHFSVRCSI